MQKLLNDVTSFHIVCDVPVKYLPTSLSPSQQKRRHKLIKEESNEALVEIDANNLSGILQECLDTIYVAVGTLLEAGLGSAAIEGWQALHESCMSKVDPETGKAKKNEFGKVLKPASFIPVDWSEIVKRHAIDLTEG